jgi:N-acetylmuramoyl-L-alanine amidase
LGHGNLLGDGEDTSPALRLPSVVQTLLVAAVAGFFGCSHPSGAPADGGESAIRIVEQARALLDPAAPIGARSDVLALAESVESAAVREGAGARAVELHTVAAELLERVYRVEGREQDAKEAVLVYRAASHDLSVEGACDAAERGARLSGDLARDASVTYAELYRVERRMASAMAPKGDPDGGSREGQGTRGACAARVEKGLVSLAAFRPPARVLEAIDQGLAGDGDVPITYDGGAPQSDVTQILKVEPWPGKDAARVVVTLSRTAHFRPGEAPGAATPGASQVVPRTFVDLDGVDVGSAPRDMPLSGIITRLRTEATSTGARITLDLDGPGYRKVFYLPEPYRVIVDVARHPPGTVASRGRRVIERVVIDPGHGGTDPGAIGPSGTREKDVTLDIAKRVAPLLTRDGLTVLLTREDDRFIPLEDRTARANAFPADLFVSIHCNAAENHVRHGVETYVLDTTKDEIASRVAARENATSQAATAEIGSILASLRMADQASHSTHLAELMQKAAMASTRDRYPDILDGGVHTAGFYVLVGARMPSILFETSYISNAVEEQRLKTDDYRQRLADAIVNAVRAYRQGR